MPEASESIPTLRLSIAIFMTPPSRCSPGSSSKGHASCQRGRVSLEDSYFRQLAPVASETPVMGDAFYLSALPPLKPNATRNTDCEAKTRSCHVLAGWTMVCVLSDHARP